MQAELLTYQDEVYGIRLTSESPSEEAAFRRLFEHGAKVNSITPRHPIGSLLHVTFADLMETRKIVHLRSPRVVRVR